MHVPSSGVTERGAFADLNGVFASLTSMQVIYNREVIYNIPRGQLKGVVIVLPACLTYITEWGFPSPTCQHCTGMPQELP